MSRVSVMVPAEARAVIDYSLDRKATLSELFKGLSTHLLDADPYLLKAAKHHGLLTDRQCPVCKKENLTELRYTYGDQLGQYSGRIKTNDEIAEMANEYGEFKVYVVEICKGCRWNHLVLSYVMGDGQLRRPTRKLPVYE